MSLNDIRTDIKYGCTIAVPKEEADLSKLDILKYKKDRQAAEMGMAIGRKKHWKEWSDEYLMYAQMDLYIFTYPELYDFMEAHFKKRMLQQAQAEYIDDKTREALQIIAERF